MQRQSVQWRLIVLVCGFFALMACSGDDDDGDGVGANVAGQFRGTIQDSLAGAGTVTATLAQSGNNVSGNFQTSFAGGNGGGTVRGTVTGGSLSVTVTPPQANACPSNVTATVSGNTISGNFSVFNCTVAETGTFTLTRQ